MVSEIWLDIPGYEGMYQSSSLGRIKTLNRFVKGRVGNIINRKEKILSPVLQKTGYYMVILRKENKSKGILVHRLVAFSFLGKTELYVHHKNSIKTDNRIENLEIVTPRQNIIYHHSKRRPCGYSKQKDKFSASIWINGKHKFLGLFKTANEARDRYNKELQTIKSKL